MNQAEFFAISVIVECSVSGGNLLHLQPSSVRKIAKGFVKIKNKTCYFNKKGKLVKNAWVIYKGKKYRADRCGTIKKNCFVKVDGKFYSLKADGSVRKGWQKFSYGISYFGKDGAIRKGLTVIHLFSLLLQKPADSEGDRSAKPEDRFFSFSYFSLFLIADVLND